MKRIIFFAVIMLLAAGVVFAKDFEVKKKAGDFEVEAVIDTNPPTTGDNNITVTIKDAAGKPVTDAKVTIDYSMPAMPGMAAMNYKTDATQKGDAYKAVMNLSMSGPWNIVVKISRDGRRATMKFNIDAR